ncbi:AAA family ATPase [Colwellia sp. 4_MG-2023]|uniref:AAA family ATPase n=1 Tax=unclassified Colwellia TaxID=196834 RepID=UPI0026E327B0|nr:MULTISPECIES: AAA family ATPase [unclassified Colwellia]MDO6505548.1 AAA family ATPase [Colwellia sp. 5_MG-2023]MDO6554156.1 AAA family ATPase [Colwellia sp. 4_MG-2023]
MENSNKSKFEVILQAQSHYEKPPLPGQIIITQSNSWNDFGYNVRCEFITCSHDGKNILSGEVLLAFLTYEDLNGRLKRVSDEYTDWSSRCQSLMDKDTKHLIKYFCLLPNMQAYRDAVTELGVNNAHDFLNSINDLVFHNTKSKKETWLKDALGSPPFEMAFMRNSEQFFAFHNADTILQGIELENYLAISQNLRLTFKLDGFTNEHFIDFKFDNASIIPKRINVLIGKNGLGKSQTLQKFCRAALERPEPISTKLFDTISNIQRPMINRIIALVTPGETNTTFPGEYAKSQRLFYRRIDLNARSSSQRNLGSLLSQIFRSKNTIRETLRCEIFKSVISKAFDIKSVYLKVSDDYYLPIQHCTYLDGNGDQVVRLSAAFTKVNKPLIKIKDDYHELSSGQLTFFKFALQCCLYIENGTLILLDEPETHLHPNFIGEFVEMLDFLLEKTGSVAIVATHSAYFVREVSGEQVHVFKESDNGHISILKPRLKTFGADIDSISQFVFNEDIENRLTDKIYQKVKGQSFEQVEALLGNELSMSALMELKDRIEGQ